MRQQQVEELNKCLESLRKSGKYLENRYDEEIVGVDNATLFVGENKSYLFLIEEKNNKFVSLTNAMPRLFSSFNDKIYLSFKSKKILIGTKNTIKIYYLSDSDNLWTRYIVEDDDYVNVKSISQEMFLEKIL